MLRTVRIILRRVDSPFSLGLINTLTFYTPALGGSIYVPGNQRGNAQSVQQELAFPTNVWNVGLIFRHFS
jgi:hypothetical protein